jgi:hypothetical protein
MVSTGEPGWYGLDAASGAESGAALGAEQPAARVKRPKRKRLVRDRIPARRILHAVCSFRSREGTHRRTTYPVRGLFLIVHLAFVL